MLAEGYSKVDQNAPYSDEFVDEITDSVKRMVAFRNQITAVEKLMQKERDATEERCMAELKRTFGIEFMDAIARHDYINKHKGKLDKTPRRKYLIVHSARWNLHTAEIEIYGVPVMSTAFGKVARNNETYNRAVQVLELEDIPKFLTIHGFKDRPQYFKISSILEVMAKDCVEVWVDHPFEEGREFRIGYESDNMKRGGIDYEVAN